MDYRGDIWDMHHLVWDNVLLKYFDAVGRDKSDQYMQW